MTKSYLVDTNIFIQAKNFHYQFGFCTQFWQWIEAAHESGVVASISKVHKELKEGRPTCPARVWADRLPKPFFRDDERNAGVMESYKKVMGWAWAEQGKGKFTLGAAQDFSQVQRADAFLVAAAVHYGCDVVTQESLKPPTGCMSTIQIPNAAQAFGVNTITIFDLLRIHAGPAFTFKS